MKSCIPVEHSRHDGLCQVKIAGDAELLYEAHKYTCGSCGLQIVSAELTAEQLCMLADVARNDPGKLATPHLTAEEQATGSMEFMFCIPCHICKKQHIFKFPNTIPPIQKAIGVEDIVGIRMAATSLTDCNAITYVTAIPENSANRLVELAKQASSNNEVAAFEIDKLTPAQFVELKHKAEAFDKLQAAYAAAQENEAMLQPMSFLFETNCNVCNEQHIFEFPKTLWRPQQPSGVENIDVLQMTAVATGTDCGAMLPMVAFRLDEASSLVERAHQSSNQIAGFMKNKTELQRLSTEAFRYAEKLNQLIEQLE
jgi:hypothetical protein